MATQYKNYIFIGSTIVAILIGYTYFLQQQQEFNSITSFEECVGRGYLVPGTYPEECKIPGKKFIHPNQIATMTSSPEEIEVVNDYRNMTYLVLGQSVTFKNGIGELPLTTRFLVGTTTLTQTDTTIFTEINNDTKKDTIFLIQTEPHHLSTSSDFYIGASISLHSGFTGINTIYVDANIQKAELSYQESKIQLAYTKVTSTNKMYKYYILKNDILEESK